MKEDKFKNMAEEVRNEAKGYRRTMTNMQVNTNSLNQRIKQDKKLEKKEAERSNTTEKKLSKLKNDMEEPK